MMHGMNTEAGSQLHSLLMEKIWDDLTEEQKAELITEMIDGKIMMKESMIEHIEHEIKMIKKMKEFLTESDSEAE